MYEAGTPVATTTSGGWGFAQALSDALHNFVNSINSLVAWFGGALPGLALLALVGWLGYRIVRASLPQAGRRPGSQGLLTRADEISCRDPGLRPGSRRLLSAHASILVSYRRSGDDVGLDCDTALHDHPGRVAGRGPAARAGRRRRCRPRPPGLRGLCGIALAVADAAYPDAVAWLEAEQIPFFATRARRWPRPWPSVCGVGRVLAAAIPGVYTPSSASGDDAARLQLHIAPLLRQRGRGRTVRRR